MGKRSRKPRAEGPRTTKQPVPAAPRASGRARMQERYARAEERNEAIRRKLEPLAPGERPGAVTIAAIVAFALGVANTVALLSGETVTGESLTIYGIIFPALCFVCAIFMWRAKYWAVLGFQALLGITVMIAAGLLMVSTSWRAAAALAAIVLLGGWLFWKLVRALARLQMPAR